MPWPIALLADLRPALLFAIMTVRCMAVGGDWFGWLNVVLLAGILLSGFVATLRGKTVRRESAAISARIM